MLIPQYPNFLMKNYALDRTASKILSRYLSFWCTYCTEFLITFWVKGPFFFRTIWFGLNSYSVLSLNSISRCSIMVWETWRLLYRIRERLVAWKSKESAFREGLTWRPEGRGIMKRTETNKIGSRVEIGRNEASQRLLATVVTKKKRKRPKIGTIYCKPERWRQ